MIFSLRRYIAHYQFRIAHCFAEEVFPQSFSLQVNAQWAMRNGQ